MHAPSFEFTPGEAVYLANACLASAAVKRKEMGLRIALDRDAMVTRARSIAGREVTISTVNKAIEESIVKYRLVRSGRERRFLPGVAIVYIASFKLLDASFSRKAKRNFYRTLAEWMERPGKTGEGARETIRLSSYLVADLGDDLQEALRGLRPRRRLGRRDGRATRDHRANAGGTGVPGDGALRHAGGDADPA